MHEPIFYLAIAWFALLLVANVVLAVRHSSVPTRILAVDTAGFLVIAVLLLLQVRSGQGYYLDSAIVIALLSFVQTTVVARFHAPGSE